jgi:hypothetical protein
MGLALHGKGQATLAAAMHAAGGAAAVAAGAGTSSGASGGAGPSSAGAAGTAAAAAAPAGGGERARLLKQALEELLLAEQAFELVGVPVRGVEKAQGRLFLLPRLFRGMKEGCALGAGGRRRDPCAASAPARAPGGRPPAAAGHRQHRNAAAGHRMVRSAAAARHVAVPSPSPALLPPSCALGIGGTRCTHALNTYIGAWCSSVCKAMMMT